MKFLLAPIFACLAVVVASAEPAKNLIVTRSFSLQFTARELRNRPVPWALGPAATPVQMGAGMTFMITAPPALAGDADKIQLEAETIGVSCERIKELLLLELALTDEWKGKVDLLINSSLPENRDPALTGIYSADGWRYELELPKIISVEKFVRAVVQTLLQEMVNRTAGSRSAEVPFWLVEGFSAHLQSFNVPTYIIRSNQQTPWGENMRVKGMADVRAALRRHEPLTFQQLCWPEQSDVAGKDETVYRGCAQLLFEDLLHFNDGQMSFQRFLTDMPGHLNWQLAFLQAFHGHFARLLDVEKWWALKCVAFTEVDLTEPGTEKECWDKLQNALDVPVEVRLAPSRNPAEARLTLQEVIMKWNSTNALPALQRTVRDLENLRWFAVRYEMDLEASLPPAEAQRKMHGEQNAQSQLVRTVSPLVDRYLAVLVNYEKRGFSGGDYTGALLFKKDTVRQLDALDREREELRTKLLSASRQ